MSQTTDASLEARRSLSSATSGGSGNPDSTPCPGLSKEAELDLQ